MSDKSGTLSQVISLPSGGGALQGIGEKFSPDPYTGTGNVTVPITLSPSIKNDEKEAGSKDGDAIRSADEEFSVNPVTGTATFGFSIFTTVGCCDFHPRLSFSYHSEAKNGPFGLGWMLFVPTISREKEETIERGTNKAIRCVATGRVVPADRFRPGEGHHVGE